MVLVGGFAATPDGCKPTGIVVVTPIVAVTGWVVVLAEDADAAGAIVVVASASPTIAAIIRVIARWECLMRSYLLPTRASGVSRRPARQMPFF